MKWDTVLGNNLKPPLSHSIPLSLTANATFIFKNMLRQDHAYQMLSAVIFELSCQRPPFPKLKDISQTSLSDQFSKNKRRHFLSQVPVFNFKRNTCSFLE